ncbi:MAG: sulfatase-like hydrolase/transferase [Thermomicrobia bacterium]|nr:sulfatase-like hydrolase/transferase [Thermomicrobia bacterium]
MLPRGHGDAAARWADDAGVQFDRAHCTAPQCSPRRASLITGCYPHANGMMGLAHRGWELRRGIRCLPPYVADGGYATALFGIQHDAYPARRAIPPA